MSKIDWKQIDEWIDKNKNRKPEYIAVDVEHWNDALDGIREMSSHVDYDQEVDGQSFTTTTLWHLMWFSATQFCRGMEYAEVKAGLRKATNYPRH